MRTRTVVAALLVCGPQLIAAQEPTRISLQAGLGVAFRAESPYVAGSTDGLHAAARLGFSVSPSFRLVGELSLTRYPDAALNVPSLCPQPGPCPRSPTSLPGLGVTGIAVGVQPQLGGGPLRLLLTATAGGYWLYHRNPSLPASAVGLRGSLGLGLDVDPRVRVVMEGGGLYFVHGRAHHANTRHVGLGFMLH